MDEVPRPATAPSPAVRVREWIEWFGLTRLVTAALAVAVVCAGAWWLVRAPVPPAESTLPLAAATGDPPSETLPTVPPPPVESSPSAASVVVVHVAGAVVEPGVYDVPAGSRVASVIAEAGGAASDADVDVLNLAAVVADGARVYVPTEGESFTAPVGESGGAEVAPVGPVDVNRATAEQLEALPGVGPATATAIVTERDRNGPFASPSDLERVPGIGPAKLAAIVDLVTT